MRKKIFVILITEMHEVNCIKVGIGKVLTNKEEAWQEVERLYYSTISLLESFEYEIRAVRVLPTGQVKITCFNEDFNQEIDEVIEFITRSIDI